MGREPTAREGIAAPCHASAAGDRSWRRCVMRTQTEFHRVAWVGIAALAAGLAACGSRPKDGIGPSDTDLRDPIEVVVTNNVIQVPENVASVPAGQPRYFQNRRSADT